MEQDNINTKKPEDDAQILNHDPALVDDYRFTGAIDLDKLKELIDKMRGKDSLSEFAKKCSYSPSSFTRLLKGEIKEPSKQMLTACWQNAVPDAGVTFNELMTAAGYRQRISPSERVALRDTVRRQTKMLIIMNLIESGLRVKELVFQEDDKTRPVPLMLDFALEVGRPNEDESQNRLRYYKDINPDYQHEFGFGEPWRMHYLNAQRNLRVLFGTIYLNHAQGVDVLYSVIVHTKEVFDKLAEQYEDTLVMDEIELLLVNIEKNYIEDRYVFQQSNK